MNSLRVSLLILACTFGASLVTIALRRQMPPDHLEGDSKDMVKLTLGLIATLAALSLGLLISSGYSAYQLQQAEVQQLSVKTFEVDRTLAQFGPETLESRRQLRQILTEFVVQVWPDGKSTPRTHGDLQLEGEQLFQNVIALAPKTELQRSVQSRVLNLLQNIGETRRLMMAQSQQELPRPILNALLLWVTVLFAGFGLLARFNMTVVLALFVSSLSVAVAVFLIVEMSEPYRGLMQISKTPLLNTIAEMPR
jgi:ABC-type multidrug transport system fused ATPase/permease subunit